MRSAPAPSLRPSYARVVRVAVRVDSTLPLHVGLRQLFQGARSWTPTLNPSRFPPSAVCASGCVGMSVLLKNNTSLRLAASPNTLARSLACLLAVFPVLSFRGKDLLFTLLVSVFSHSERCPTSESNQFSSVASDSLRPHGLQHARPPCPSPTRGVYSNSCPSSR